MPLDTFLDPNARVDYRWNWVEWLEAIETITSATVVGTNVTVEAPIVATDGKSVTAWVSGAVPGTRVALTCHIMTSKARRDDRTIRLSVIER